jgi:hypothetical protein
MKTMFLLDHTGFSEENYTIIKEINETVSESLEEVSIAVNDVTNNVIDPHTAITNVAEIGCFQDGVLISTNLLNAGQILSAYTSSRKILYLWDLDWMHKPYNYEWIYDVLSNDGLEIIVRSESHRIAVLNLCGKEPLGILQNLKLEQLWNLLENTKKK